MTISNQNTKKNKIEYLDIILRAYDEKILDNAVKSVLTSALEAAVDVRCVVPLPIKKRKYTLLSGPHIDKNARHQLEIISRKRLIRFVSSNAVVQFLNNNMKPLPSEVSMDMKARHA